MTLVSWNVNGLRSVLNKGFVELLRDWNADVVCLQEVKAREDQIDPFWEQWGYQGWWSSAEKPGYSGVLTLSRHAPDRVWTLDLPEFDREGRLLGLDFGPLTVINAYFPNSQEGGARLEYKLAFCQTLENKLESLKNQGNHVVICGDFNIAHQPIDLTNPKQNEKNPGYLPEERAWMSHFLGLGWVDTFRTLYPETIKYTWWSYRFNARQKNIGWRIDYFCVSPSLMPRVADSQIWDQVLGSDHCPVALFLRNAA